MLNLASAIALAVVGIAAVAFPPAIAAISILNLPTDTPGLAQHQVLQFPNAFILLLSFVAMGRVLYELWRRRRCSAASGRIFKIALLATAVSWWTALSILVGGRLGISDVVYAGFEAIPGAVFAVAYHRNRVARALFIAILAAQLVIGYGIVTFPGSAMTLLRPAVGAGPETPHAWDVSPTHKDNAQFAHSGQFAFYGAVGLVVGVYFLVYSRGAGRKIFGAGLIYLGVVSSLVTVCRALWLGIPVALVVLLIPIARTTISRAAYGLAAAYVGLWLYVALAGSTSPTVSAIREYFMSVREDQYRIPAAIGSVDVLLTKPIFGANGDIEELVNWVGGVPHQSFYYYATMYGLPAGICLLVITWWTLSPNFIRRRIAEVPGFGRPEQHLARAIGWLVLAMAMTNGMSAGMFAWICLGFACMPWAYSLPRQRVVASRAPAPLSRRRTVAPASER